MDGDRLIQKGSVAKFRCFTDCREIGHGLSDVVALVCKVFSGMCGQRRVHGWKKTRGPQRLFKHFTLALATHREEGRSRVSVD